MRVFITGATGYIGSALVRAFAAAKHEVGGLVRTREKEAQVRADGGVPIFGRLEDAELYQHFAAEAAVVIHAAAPDPERDPRVAEALISAQKAEGEDKMFVLTSGCLVLGATGEAPVDEGGSTDRPFELVAWRPSLERSVLDQATQRFHTAVVRPGWVYGGKSGGVLAGYVQSAAQRGAAEYVGDGKNKMAYVELEELAQLYVRLAERRARGVFHAVDGSDVTNLELATLVSKAVGKGGEVRSVPLSDAQRGMGPFAAAFVLHQRLATTRSVELGWVPKQDIRRAIDAAAKSFVV